MLLCVACYRYACTLPHAHIIFCDAVYEFGKKGDLVSALIAYEASKKNSTSTNMYLYRTIIDVCGRCHDYQKSRYIYEVFATFTVLFQIGLLNWNFRYGVRFSLFLYAPLPTLKFACL